MDDQNTAIGAIGAVLGYIGAEGATPAMFERLLWPQRAHLGFTYRHVLKLALFGSTGGPVYKAALQVLDNAYSHGLLQGAGLGHMLGSSFFPQSESMYVLDSTDRQYDSHSEPSRNCLWERVSASMPPYSGLRQKKADMEHGHRTKQQSRSQVSVHHITLEIRDLPASATPVLNTDTETGAVSLRTLAGILTSELSGIVFSVLVAAICRTWVAILWLCPLFIKMASALAALKREPLQLENSSNADQDFEVQMPLETGSFLILTGPSALILQFFRHYGHPKRSRIREVVQLALVVASAVLFPLGLLFSITIMSNTTQYFWVSHQMYLVVAMYISRYMSPQLWASTEEVIAEKLWEAPTGAYLWADRAHELVLKAEVKTTYHGRYGEARNHVKDLLASRRDGSRKA